MVHHRNTALLDDKDAQFDSNVLDFEVIFSAILFFAARSLVNSEFLL
jgi:hypothetical protein